MERSAAKKRGIVELRAVITVPAGHVSLERIVEDIRGQFANDFSCYVHEFYPDARITADAFVERDV